MSLEETVTRVLARYGSVWTYRTQDYADGPNAWTVGTLTETFTQFIAQGNEATPLEIAHGGLQQGDWTVIIDPTTLAAQPAVGDMIAPGSYTSAADGDWLQIVAVRAPSEGTATRVWKLTARK